MDRASSSAAVVIAALIASVAAAQPLRMVMTGYIPTDGDPPVFTTPSAQASLGWQAQSVFTLTLDFDERLLSETGTFLEGPALTGGVFTYVDITGTTNVVELPPTPSLATGHVIAPFPGGGSGTQIIPDFTVLPELDVIAQLVVNIRRPAGTTWSDIPDVYGPGLDFPDEGGYFSLLDGGFREVAIVTDIDAFIIPAPTTAATLAAATLFATRRRR